MLNVLIAEAEEMELGGYEVIGVVGSDSEARELAQSDMDGRVDKLMADADPGLCPFVYKVYSRGTDGYTSTLEIRVDELA